MSWGELPGQLERFSDSLRREERTKRTAEFIKAETGRFMAEWKAERRLTAQRMPIPIPRDQGIHPVGCETQECYLSFRFEADVDAKPICAEFQVQVEGLLLIGEALIELQDHWRIDSEKVIPPKEQPATEGREPHPAFHFQRGGHAQDAFARDFGFVPGAHTELGAGVWRGLMQYPGPRIATLPFDPLLAIDFCIAQNDGPLWRRLRNVPEYFTVIEEAQHRLWKPFIAALADAGERRRWLGPVVVF